MTSPHHQRTLRTALSSVWHRVMPKPGRFDLRNPRRGKYIALARQNSKERLNLRSSQVRFAEPAKSHNLRLLSGGSGQISRLHSATNVL